MVPSGDGKFWHPEQIERVLPLLGREIVLIWGGGGEGKHRKLV